MKLDPARLDVVVWSSIYGGLLLLGFGLALQRDLPTAGWLVAAIGVLAALAGFVLIGVRSRLPDRAAAPKPPTAPAPRHPPRRKP